MTTVVRVLRFQEICIIAPQLLLLLLLLLLPLPLSRSSPCPTTVEEMIVSTTSDAERLAEALLCDGQAALTVSWNGEIMPSRTLHVSNRSTLNVTGSSENSADTIITSDGTVLLFQVDLESTVLLTGLTLFGGDGALRVTGGSFVEVIYCSFTQNKRTSSDQGGAVYIKGSSIVFKDKTFFGNNRAIYGGAIYADDHSNVSFRGYYTDFDNNRATDGGAIYAIGSSELDVTGGDVYFWSNNAVGSGGALYARDHINVSFGGETHFNSNTAIDGGAIYAIDSSELEVTDGSVTFYGNQAVGSGGAIYADDHINVSFGGEAIFVNNTATDGGAIYAIDSSELEVTDGKVSFFGNQAVGSGGAIAVVDGSTIHVNGMTSFVANEATDDAGAVYASYSSVSVGEGILFKFNHALLGSGGGVYALNSAIALTGCRFDGNSATEGGAIYSAEGSNEVVNSDFTRNYAVVQGGAFLHSGTFGALTGCIFESNTAGVDGLAVAIFGLLHITNVTFRNNSFYCASGEYALEENNDTVENLNTCRWGVVCSHCTELCEAPADINMDESTVPDCEEVPKGVDTSGNGGMTLETLNIMPGFCRTSNKSRTVLECYREKSCLGGSDASHYCEEGYAGPYCAACVEGYGSGFQYSCHSCQGSDKWAPIGGAVAILAVLMIVVVFGVTYLVGVVDRPISERNGMWATRVFNFRDGLVNIIPLTAIKIVLVSWQIITQFSTVVNVQYPPAYEKVLAALDLVNLDLGSILSLSCVLETNFYARLTLVTIAPMAILGVLAFTYGVAMLRNGHSVRAKRLAKNKHLSVGLFVLFIVYSSVSHTIFQTFACDSLEFGVTYLRADYDLECWTKTHVAFMTYAGFMVLLYPVGIPAVFAWVLYMNRHGIKSVAGSTDRCHLPPEPEAIKDLWAPYKRSRYYYEVIECGRRIALTGLSVFIYPGSTAQVAMEALLAVVFPSISEMLSPFAEPLDAWLYRFGTWAIFLHMSLTLLLKMDSANEDPHSQIFFARLLIAAHVGMILIVIANALLSALK